MRFVGEPLPGPDGPWLLIDASDASGRTLDRLCKLVGRCLNEVGLAGGTLTTVPKRPAPVQRLRIRPDWYRLELSMLPHPPGRVFARTDIPAQWLHEGWTWVRGDVADDDLVHVIAESSEFALAARDVPAFFEQCRGARVVWATVVAGDLKRRARLMTASFHGWQTDLALFATGFAYTDDDLLAVWGVFADIARRAAATLAQAFVRPHVHPRVFPPMESASPDYVNQFCDELLMDAAMWHVLAPGHVARLGGPPPGAQELAAGRVELTVGDAEHWLSADHDVRVRTYEQARRLLAPCLLSRDEAHRLDLSRRHTEPQPAPSDRDQMSVRMPDEVDDALLDRLMEGLDDVLKPMRADRDSVTYPPTKSVGTSRPRRVKGKEPAPLPPGVSARWSRHPPLPSGREDFGATCGPDGHIYTVGGHVKSKTVEVYEPATRTWRQARSLCKSRRKPGVATGGDGRIYAVGGFGSWLERRSTVEAYDIAENSWELVAPVGEEFDPDGGLVCDMLACASPDGRIYAMALHRRPLAVYDPSSDAWTQLAPIDISPSLVACLSDGRLVAIQGAWRDVEMEVRLYLPKEDRWVPGARPLIRRSLFGGAVAQDGRLYLLGGQIDNTTGSVDVLDDVEVYVPDNDGWELGERLPQRRYGHCVTGSPRGGVLVIGGGDWNFGGPRVIYEPAGGIDELTPD